MEKPLIALLTNNDDDIYCFRLELIEAIIKNKYRILISCPEGPKLELMANIKYIYDNPPIDRRGTNVIADMKLLLHYEKLLRRYRPDVVLTYTAKPNVYASIAARHLNIPVINNVTGYGSVLNQTKLMQKFIMSLFKIAYRSSTCIMFQNETNMKIATDNHLVKGRCRLIPGSGVNTERYPLQPYPEGGNGLEGKTVIFNYIGRILRDKGVDDFIEAAKRIKSKYPKTEFNMIGFIEPTEIYYEKKLKELEKDGILFYRGSHKDIRPWIERSHAIIHPSTYGEGMSNVLLENASSGRAIITTDNPGCKETVENGRNGFIYHGGNIEELIEAIEKFLKLENKIRKNMGEEGKKRVKKLFERQIVIDAYLEEIQDILVSNNSKKLFFYSNHREDDLSIGISKKVKSQIKEIRKRGIEVFYSAYFNSGIGIFNNDDELVEYHKCILFTGWMGHIIRRKDILKISGRYIKKTQFDYVYMRFHFWDGISVKFLKDAKSKLETKIVVEAHSYPYKSTARGLSYKILYWLDDIYQKKVYKYIDLVAAVTEERDRVWGCKTIAIENGINTIDNEKRNINKRRDNEIRMICVANESYSHGVDRLLKGFFDYYREGGKRNIVVWMVGEYRGETYEMIRKYKLEEKIIFLGKCYGSELSKLYADTDIGVGPLALFRQKAHSGTCLKTKEYFAVGIPFITSADSTALINDFPYVCVFPENNSGIEIQKVIDFYDKLPGKEQIAEEMHEFAVKNYSWEREFDRIFKELS